MKYNRDTCGESCVIIEDEAEATVLHYNESSMRERLHGTNLLNHAKIYRIIAAHIYVPIVNLIYYPVRIKSLLTKSCAY